MRRIATRAGGFTLMEIVVVLAVVAVLAAVMTPSVIKHLNDSKVARATKEVETIATALTSFYKDTGRWPTDMDTNKSVGDQEARLLRTAEGDLPAERNGNIGWLSLNPQETFENQIILNRPAGSNANRYDINGSNAWDGPYLNEIKSDPWGRTYLCNVANVHPGQNGPVWIISAGPDGVLDTRANNRTLQNDDIGFMLRR